MFLDFGKFSPDLPSINNPGSPNAKNAIPGTRGYYPFPSLAIVTTDATTARPQGGFSHKKPDGTIFTCVGDATKLYQVDGVNINDITRSSGGAYACDSDDMWHFTSFGNEVIAVNIADDIQGITIGTDSNFSKFVSSTLEPKAKFITTVGEFPVIAYTNESSTDYPYRVRWPSINDATDFDESATNQSDHQDLFDGGQITGITGNKEYGTIITETSLHRMDYVGGQIFFNFDKIEGSKGCRLPNSIIGIGRDVFYRSPEGFYKYDGVNNVPIGTEQVDTFFHDDFDITYPNRISTAIDLERKIVVWSYPGDGNTAGLPNKLLFYRYDIGMWGCAEVEQAIIFPALSTGFTLEQLDNVNSSLDLLPASLDADAWQGGVPGLAGFNSSFKFGMFNGAALTAQLDTRETNLIKGRFGYVDSVRPIVEGSDATVTVEAITRDLQTDTVTENGAVAVQSTGEAFLEESARYHRFRVNISGGFTHAVGINDIDVTEDGAR